MKRGPADAKQDLEDITEEENVDQLIKWLQTDFRTKVEEFKNRNNGFQSNPPVAQTTQESSLAPSQPEKSAPKLQEKSERKEEQKRKSSSEKKNGFHSQPVPIPPKKEIIQPEVLDSKTKEQNKDKEKPNKSSLSKRKPEIEKKPDQDEKKTIFDRIKPKEGTEQPQGNKRQGGYQQGHQKPPFQPKNPNRQPSSEAKQEEQEIDKAISQEENAARQAKLQQFLSKFKKVPK